MCQPLLIVGNLNADAGVIPCLAEGISSGRFVDLALAHSVGAGLEPDMTCKFKLDECAWSWRDFAWWFTHHFSLLAEFSIRQWAAEVSFSRATKPVWPACWIDMHDRSASRMFVIFIMESWVLFHLALFLLSGRPLRPWCG